MRRGVLFFGSLPCLVCLPHAIHRTTIKHPRHGSTSMETGYLILGVAVSDRGAFAYMVSWDS